MTEQRKTLVILSPAFPENEAATYWVPSQQLLVKAMKRNFPHWDFVVLALLYPYHKREYSWHNIQVSSYNGVSYPGPKRLLLWWKVWRKLKKLRREKKLAGILSFWCMESALVGAWFARRYRLPHFCWICGQDARANNRYIKLIRPRAGELVAISDFVAEEFYRNHRILPRHVVPNAIDEEIFPAKMPFVRDIDILGVGALIPLKQFDVLIKITESLRKHIPGIQVRICGIGEERENLVSLINNAGLHNNIQLTGALKHEEVLQLLQRTKLLVHPSAYEGFSTVCLEALYAGAGVVSFVKPMKHDIRNWQIAVSTADMTAMALRFLQTNFMHESITIYSMNDIAKDMMHLYDPPA
jgi:glycosyltransferase involved in cell wall biosynthesis